MEWIQGYRIIIHCLNSIEAANILANELNAIRSDSVFTISADISQNAGCEELMEKVLDSNNLFKGRLDVLVNNASAFYPTSSSDFNEKEWHELINTNLKAPYHLSLLAKSQLQEYQGSIINISDIHGENPLKGYSMYSISKAGLIAMTKSLSKELAPEVRVNGVSPGAILWPEAEEGDTDKHAEVLSKVPLGKMGQVEDIAKAVAFVLQNTYITGQIIRVDGGRTE